MERPKVLVIDDDELVLTIVRETLEFGASLRMRYKSKWILECPSQGPIISWEDKYAR